MIPTRLPSLEFAPRHVNPPGLNNWAVHLPFARDLIDSLRPGVIVELGTHFGESYFGFCQAVVEAAVDCKCYAVDTWQGDDHAGYYGDSVFDGVKEHNTSTYPEFSHLLRMTFDEALGHFEDSSISLLHIDGLHTYDAVSHDFRTWWAKVRPGGLVLIHDVCARHAGFGVWRLWEELQREFRTFTLPHSWGLGVVQKPGGDTHELLALDPAGHGYVSCYYSMCGERVMRDIEASRRAAGGTGRALLVQSWLAGDDVPGRSEWVAEGQWQAVSLRLTPSGANSRVQLSLLHCAGIAQVKHMCVKDGDSQLWEAGGGNAPIEVEGDAMLLPSTVLTILSYGNYHRLLLPSLRHDQRELTVEIELCVTTELESVLRILHGHLDSLREIARLSGALRQAAPEWANGAGLEAAVEALGAASRERTALLSSWSWRLMRPVRSVAAAVGYGRSRNG